MTRNADGSFEVFDGAMSRAITEAKAIAGIVRSDPKPAGFDWRAQQQRLPRVRKGPPAQRSRRRA
ncbi:MAG TPA: hypothetical protein VIL88_17760 [Devosia sp.]